MKKQTEAEYIRQSRMNINQAETHARFNECYRYANIICDESSGVVSKDFPEEVGSLIKLLLCYNKKQFYIFVDDKNSNSLRVSSRKQYLIINALLKKFPEDNSYAKITRRNFSQEASITRLVREAIKYNKYAKFLKRLGEAALIEFCSQIMKSTSCGFKIIDADIQKCYNSELNRMSNIGSGERFATSSCMYNKQVGKFYDMFNVKGKMIIKDGVFVGRYLEWKMANGKTYVDRLYVNGDVVTPALSCVDDYYKGRTDVEFYPNEPSSVVEMKKGNAKDFDKLIYFPYIDTFADLHHNEDTDKMYLSQEKTLNAFDENKRLKSTCYEANIFEYYTCPSCGKKFMSLDALRFHLLFETKTNKGRAYENNQKIKNIINKYMEEIRHE